MLDLFVVLIVIVGMLILTILSIKIIQRSYGTRFIATVGSFSVVNVAIGEYIRQKWGMTVWSINLAIFVVIAIIIYIVVRLRHSAKNRSKEE